MLSDQGTPFLNKLTTELYALFNVKRLTTSGHHPETNGSCERFNQSLGSMLSKYVDSEQRKCDDALQYLIFAFNTSKHDVTKTPPFKMLYGPDPTLPIDIVMPTVADPFVKDLQSKMTDIHATALARIEQRQNYFYANDDRPDVQFQPGDFVLVFNPAGKLGKATKLLSRYYGPY